jgi:hypothetical protein
MMLMTIDLDSMDIDPGEATGSMSAAPTGAAPSGAPQVVPRRSVPPPEEAEEKGWVEKPAARVAWLATQPKPAPNWQVTDKPAPDQPLPVRRVEIVGITKPAPAPALEVAQPPVGLIRRIWRSLW